MADVVHSLGPTCAYHEHDPDLPLPEGSEPPPVKSQFFYVSSLPIDDPLSPLPPIPSDHSAKQPPQPFSALDNAALEEAWQGFQTTQEPERQKKLRPNLMGMFSFPKFKKVVKSAAVISPPADEVYSQISGDHDGSQKSPAKSSAIDGDRNSGSESIIKDRGRESSKRTDQDLTPHSDVMLAQSPPQGRNDTPINNEELRRDPSKPEQVDKPKSHRHLSPFRQKPKAELVADSRDLSADSRDQVTAQPTAPSTAPDISGRPFARAPSKRDVTLTDRARDSSSFEPFEGEQVHSRSRSRDRGKTSKQRANSDSGKVYVPVGIARLHLVEMPDLMMKPIYWSPINDTSNVIRATWFYKDTMMPVPADVANRLEVGYEYIKPYFESYQDELQACIENGAAAEMKIVHRLWPEEKKGSRPNTGDTKIDEMSEEGDLPLPTHIENLAFDSSERGPKRHFETYSIIYTDRKNAQILKPNLLPSITQKRRPLSSIRRGHQVGIAVVRGFERSVWSRLHPGPKMSARTAHARIGAYMSQSGDATTRDRRSSCAACESGTRTSPVSDLVLVIHGIGQKLSERVDSYHFTHAINGFRREFNVELSSENVKGNLQEETGIMVLPVNWRLTVSFDQDLRSDDANQQGSKYQLPDITPDTLPAVRSIISDVMLDIPYYMSHHKDKMIAAVVREANRVYRLWCRNNPGFQEHGRVHLIGHSLGSVMAMEILSNQPTRIPKDIILGKTEPSDKMFEFDTTNLFCCGSPAGFFLLLNNAKLIPRKGRGKAGMEGEDFATGVAGESRYGCLAVDNLYNVCHRNDPIAYLLNAAVDPEYAASLQPANIPSVTTSLLASLWASKSKLDAYSNKGPVSRPTMQNMPSTVELETHNFTREEISEKRMFLLNENGQVDYYLSSSGGPLEIQYLSMLSAHSSYWISRDFVRFLVVEIGRQPGKGNTVEVLRGVKKREWKRGVLN